MIQTTKEWNIDIWGLSEINILWNNIDRNHQWYERAKHVRPHQTNFAHNQHESNGKDKFLPGGVGQMATSDVAGRIVEHGKDESGLGRWVWQKYQGKYDYILRVVTFYRPCKGETQEVEYSACTYAQHCRYFDDPNIEPRQRMLQDLSTFLQICITNNEKLVVLGDLNDDVRDIDMFSKLGLSECITTKFQHPPPTYNRTKQFSRPIDGIWTSPDVIVQKCGYSAFDEGSPSDHRLIWEDIEFQSIFGCPWNTLPRRKAKRLKYTDPRIVKQYNARVHKELVKANLTVRIKNLFQQSQNGWSKEMEKEYNAIHREQQKIRESVERNIRKLKTGAVPWSPELQKYRDKI